MAITDSDHLPVRTIGTGDTFNDWRRITNSIALSAGAVTETGSHLYLGDFDWTDRISQSSSLAIGATDGTETVEGAAWSPDNSVSYDSAEGGIRVTAANVTPYTSAPTGKMNQWVRIRTRIPIDKNANYRIKVRLKNLRTSGDNKIYLGVASLNENYKALRLDDKRNHNYFVTNYNLPNNDVTEFSALYHGFNPLDPEVGSNLKFDPGAKYFDIVFVNLYRPGSGLNPSDPWTSADDDVIIQSVEIERLTSGIIITEHDFEDQNPRAQLQLGYNTEDTGSFGTLTGSNFPTLNVAGNALFRSGSLIFGPGSEGSSTNYDMIYSNDSNDLITIDGTLQLDPDTPHGDSYHFQYDNSFKVSENDYIINSHRSTLRAGRIVMDTQNDLQPNSLANALYIRKSRNYSQQNITQSAEGLLHLAIGANNATSTGAGPAINFYTPDNTLTGNATGLSDLVDVELDNTVFAGQIACVKSEVGATNPQNFGTADLVFKVARNEEQPTEILRLHPQGYGDGTSRLVTVGTDNNTASLKVTKHISEINGLSYSWPDVRVGGAVDPTTQRVLASDSSGNLGWRQVGGITQNITAFVQNETAPIGSVFAWAGTSQTIPKGFVECIGQSVHSIIGGNDSEIEATEVAALYNAIGTTYGAEAGEFTADGTLYPKFKLPNLQERVVVGREVDDTNFDTGDTGGSATPTMPAHTHFAFSNSNSNPGVLYRNPNDQVQSSGTNNEVVNEAAGEDPPIADVDENRSYLMLSTTGAAVAGKTSSTSAGDNTIGNYSPYLAITYIIKVKADKIATLNVDLGDDEFSDFATTGGTTGELGFDTTELRLSDGHPTWTGSGHLFVNGVDLRMNTKPDYTKGDNGRQQGRAIVAAQDGLAFNWPSEGAFDFDRINLRGNKVIAGDLSNAEIDAAGNQSVITKSYLESRLPKETLLVYQGSTIEIDSKGDTPAGIQVPLVFEHVRDASEDDPDTAATDINDAGIGLSSNEFTLNAGTYDIEVKATVSLNTSVASTPGLHVAGWINRKSDNVKILISNVVEKLDNVDSRTTHHCFIKGRIVVPTSFDSNDNVFDLRFYKSATNDGLATIGSDYDAGFIGAPNPPQVHISIKKI